MYCVGMQTTKELSPENTTTTPYTNQTRNNQTFSKLVNTSVSHDELGNGIANGKRIGIGGIIGIIIGVIAVVGIVVAVVVRMYCPPTCTKTDDPPIDLNNVNGERDSMLNSSNRAKDSREPTSAYEQGQQVSQSEIELEDNSRIYAIVETPAGELASSGTNCGKGD